MGYLTKMTAIQRRLLKAILILNGSWAWYVLNVKLLVPLMFPEMPGFETWFVGLGVALMSAFILGMVTATVWNLVTWIRTGSCDD